MYCYLPLAPSSLLFSIHNAVYKEINELDQKLDQLSTMGDTNRYTLTFFSKSILQETFFRRVVTSTDYFVCLAIRQNRHILRFLLLAVWLDIYIKSLLYFVSVGYYLMLVSQ